MLVRKICSKLCHCVCTLKTKIRKKTFLHQFLQKLVCMCKKLWQIFFTLEVYWKTPFSVQNQQSNSKNISFLCTDGLFLVYDLSPKWPCTDLYPPNTALRRQSDLWGLGSRMLEIRGRYDVAYYSPYLSFLWVCLFLKFFTREGRDIEFFRTTFLKVILHHDALG